MRTHGAEDLLPNLSLRVATWWERFQRRGLAQTRVTLRMMAAPAESVTA